MQIRKIGLIAGKGKFPFFFIKALQREEVEVVVIGLKGEASPELENRVEKIYWLGLGDLGRLIGILNKEGIKEVVTLGRVAKARLFSGLRLDVEAKSLLANLEDRSDDSLLGAIKDRLAQAGIRVADPREFLSPLIPGEGVLTERKPSQGEEGDIEFGRRIAKEIARILKMSSLTMVVKDQTILAVESAEGTDKVIKRGGELAKEKVVVVKVARPGEGLLLDLPVVGPETLRVMKEAGASCLAIDAQKTILLDREELIQMADQAGIAIVAK